MERIKDSTSFETTSYSKENIWDQYSRELEKSGKDKARLTSFMPAHAERVAEFGCGSGVLLSWISYYFPYLDITGIDYNDILIKFAQEKLPHVRFIEGDISFPLLKPLSLDAAFFCSVLHELYSSTGETGVVKALKLAASYLRPGGRMVIRDTLKPPSQAVKLRFKNSYAKDRFHFFIKQFKGWQIQPKHFDNNLVELNMTDCFEFLFKYFYTICWNSEMEEIHGYFEAETFQDILYSLGLNVIYKETYLIPYLEEKWSEDVELLNAPFPHSTILIVAEKTGATR